MIPIQELNMGHLIMISGIAIDEEIPQRLGPVG